MLKKVLKVFLILVFLAFSVFLIGLGFYYKNLSKPSYVYKKGISIVDSAFRNYIKPDEKYIFDDNFTVDGIVSFNLSSEKLEKEKVDNSDYQEKVNIINNLNNMNIKYTIIQDSKNKKLFAELDEKILDEDFFNYKYLIANSTEYYLVKDILSNYVNAGTNNYFETVLDDDSVSSNINYLYNLILESIADNLGESSNVEKKVVNINNKDIEVNEISYELNNKSYINLLNEILKDLKDDDKAYSILSNADKNFSKRKVSDKSKYINKNEKYVFNIYCSKYIYKPLKYEFEYHKKDDIYVYSYEGDNKKGNFHYSVNGKIKYKAKIKMSEKKAIIEVFDEFDKSIGTIKYDKDLNSSVFNVNLKASDKVYELIFSSKYLNYKKGESYSNNSVLSFKVSDKSINYINGEVVIDSDVKAQAKIDEELGEVVLKSALDDSQKERFDNLFSDIYERLKK